MSRPFQLAAVNLAPDEICVWKIWSNDVRAKDMWSLDASEGRRAEKFRDEHARLPFLCAHIARRQLAAEILGHGTEPSALRFAQNPFGKPELVGTKPPLFCNLSHAGDLTLIGFSRAKPARARSRKDRREL